MYYICIPVTEKGAVLEDDVFLLHECSECGGLEVVDLEDTDSLPFDGEEIVEKIDMTIVVGK